MRYLGLALYAEGPTDYRFLSPILRRSADDLCLREAEEMVQIGDVYGIDAPVSKRPPDRALRIFEAATEAVATFHVLFVHADGAGDPGRARAERVQPAIDLARSRALKWAEGIVAVVPVRETESWALADGDALRQAFGTTLDDARLGLPSRVAEVETLLDPERSLDQAYEAAVGRGRPGRKAAGVLSLLGEGVRLDSLRKLPSFRRFEEGFRLVLLDQGFIRHP